jgi:peptide/nickel transport system substrate-binding protein
MDRTDTGEVSKAEGADAEGHMLSRRELVTRGVGLGVALVVPGILGSEARAATRSIARRSAASSAHFLIAENFWADWDPYQTTAQSQYRVNQQIYDYLLDFPTGDLAKPSPMLATAWHQVNPRTWEFKLRQGVTFHNGQAFTAADVKASVEFASGATKAKSVYAGFWVPTTVKVIDDHTVRLTSQGPFGALFAAINQTQIVSAADLAGPKSKLKKQPNGTGPFKLLKDAPTTKTMEANSAYWRTPPKIGTLVWEFVQDAQTRLNALLAGQVHAIDRVPPEHFKIIQRSSKLALQSVTGIESVNLWVHPDRLDLWTKNEHFRRAANWAIDRNALVKNLVQGKSAVAHSYVPTKALYYHASAPAYTFDAAKAKAELTAAGASDGGPEFQLWVATGFLPRATDVVQSIANSMQQVGLKPKIITSDVSGLIDDIFSKKGKGLMYHLSWSSNGDPFTALQPYGGSFVWSDGDKKLDALNKAGVSTTNQAKRKQIYAELQTYMWQKAPHVPLYNSDFTVAHAENLQGVRVQPNFSTYFYPATLA